MRGRDGDMRRGVEKSLSGRHEASKQGEMERCEGGGEEPKGRLEASKQEEMRR
jgi:hypothetical protein